MARYYLDSSAATKLVLIEAESAALSEFLRGEHEPVTTRLTVLLEVGRAVRRTASGEPLRARFQQLWQRFDVQELSVQMLEAAEGAGLRTWSPRWAGGEDDIGVLAAATDGEAAVFGECVGVNRQAGEVGERIGSGATEREGPEVIHRALAVNVGNGAAVRGKTIGSQHRFCIEPDRCGRGDVPAGVDMEQHWARAADFQ